MSIKKLLAYALSIAVAFCAASAGTGGTIAPGANISYASAQQQQQGGGAGGTDCADDPNLTVISPRNVSYTTQEVFIGALERSAGFDARLNYPNTVSVLIPREGMFVSMNVSSNDWVEEGDPIAVFSVLSNELEIDEATLALELAESAQRREIEALEDALNEARDRLDTISGAYEPFTNVYEGAYLDDGAGLADEDENINLDEGESFADEDEGLADEDEDEGLAGEDEGDDAYNDEGEDAYIDEGEDAYIDDDEDAYFDEDDDSSDANGYADDENNTGTSNDADGDGDNAPGGDGLEIANEEYVTPSGMVWGKPSELRRAELAVFIAEENLEFALYNGERNLDFMRARLTDLKDRSEDFTVFAPISGFVYDLVYFTVGRSVYAWQFLCRISDPELFQIVISAPNLTQLRLGAPVSIETSRRDAPSFGGHVIGNTTLLGRNESESRAIIEFDDPQALINFGEGSIMRLSGLRYRVQIEQADIQNVLLAPRRAINTESNYRFVNLLEDGLSKKRYVLMGLTNIEYAQILDGLNPGDVLIMN